MNFFETNLGRNFFQSQIPNMISALSKIGEALNKPKPALQIQTEVPENYLTDLYHGNLNPCYAEDSPDVADCTQRIMQIQTELYQDLPVIKREQIEDYRALLDERCIKQCEQAYAAGFRCAMTMLAAGLSAPNSSRPAMRSCPDED